MNLRHYNPDILKQLREGKGDTQEMVASRLNVHRQTIYRAEKGMDVPYELLCDLADYYGIEVISLLYPKPIPAEAVAA